MVETHDGAEENYSEGRVLALKIKKLGYYWPTMITNYEKYAKIVSHVNATDL